MFLLGFRFDIRERFRNSFISVIDRLVELRPVFCYEPVLGVPDVERCWLKFDIGDRVRIQMNGRLHWQKYSP